MMDLMDRPFNEIHEIYRICLLEDIYKRHREQEEQEKAEREAKQKAELKKASNNLDIKSRSVRLPTDALVKNSPEKLVMPSSEDIEDLLEEVD